MNCDDICMCLVNKQFELLNFVFNLIYVGLKYIDISLSLLLLGLCSCGACSHAIVPSLPARLSWYPMWCERWLC